MAVADRDAEVMHAPSAGALPVLQEKAKTPLDRTPHLRTSSIPAEQLLPGIHALRAVAALSVAVFHLQHLAKISPPRMLSVIGTHFGLGVQLFFVLSAFSLGFSTSPTMCRPTWLRDYLIKRFFRIAPLFYFMLLAYVGLFLIKRWPLPDASTWLLNVMFVYNFIPGRSEGIVWASWTIGVEMPFYLVFPVLLSISNRLAVQVLLLIGGILASVNARALIEGAGPALGNYSFAAFVSSVGVFAAGLMSYQLFSRSKARISSGRWTPRVVQGICAAFALLCLLVIISPFGVWMVRAGRPDIMAWGVLFGTLALWQGLFPGRWFASRGLQWVGERSYSVYLLHPLLIFELTPFLQKAYASMQGQIGDWGFLVCAALLLAALLVCSNLTYHMIERPGLRLGKMVLTALRKQDEARC
jgi:peptidoglycan/LPS O-acetylase OafA/YrhL